MAAIRVLVGTRKGAFILTSDQRRKQWSIDGPHFAGWEIYHVNGSPLDPDRLLASQTSSWFGQIIQRSDEYGQDLLRNLCGERLPVGRRWQNVEADQ